MKRAVFFFIAFIIFVILIMAVGSVFVAVRMEEKRPPPSVAGARKESEDFLKVGNLVSSDSGWKLVYEEPGKPALTADLIFSDKSACVSIGPVVCDASVFTSGLRVSLEGLVTPEGKVAVTRLTPSL